VVKLIKSISIKRFKAIENASLDLHGTDILIGGNNSGKSSALQAIQFAVSILQTLKLNNSLNFKKDKDSLGTSLSPEQLIYSPIKDVNLLLYGADPLREGEGRSISIKIENDEGNGTSTAEVTISKGRNKNIVVSLKGAALCNKNC
jgi:AAA15 family ATPase/GTPase